ncbi:MAG: (S)-benzoin forming benzil reductase [Spirochaetota bacterium]
MHFVIITGTSSGIGEAVADEFLHSDTSLFCISRSVHKPLMDRAAEKGCMCHYIAQDLTDVESLKGIMEEVFVNVHTKNPERITLINNAGTVAPVGPVETNNPSDITRAFLLNVIAPITLTSHFIKMAEDLSIPKTVINISSGAAQRPVWGWSTYCSAKSAIDMFTMTAALEQSDAPHPAKVIAFAPGIVDTPMQEKIRNTHPDNFKDRDTFISYKKNGQLLSTATVAQRIKEIALDDSIKNGSVLHI